MRIPKLAALFVASLLLFPLSQPIVAAEEVLAQSPVLLITEFQTGGSENAAQEFVELYNAGETAVDLVGWQLQYLSAGGSNWLTKATLSGALEAGGYYGIATVEYPAVLQKTMSSGLSATGGHLRILPPQADDVGDLVGWGSALYSDGSATPAPAAGMSSQRCENDSGYLDTDSNEVDFQEYLPTPGVGILCATEEDEEPAATSCLGIIFSEILPNPAGADRGLEFIELYNPTDQTISLEGCSMEIGSQNYGFGAVQVQPGSYLVLSDSQTNITLPNTSGGTIYLLSQNTEMATVTYPASMSDETVWAWDNTQWQVSYSPTPSSANVILATKPCPTGQIRSEETGRCRSASSSSTGLTPCKKGQVRNPETNRCRSSATTGSSLVPCRPGQTRNPATNRCRSTTAAAATLVPCKPGQERNPATNRCRSTTAASTELKPCAENQERNPETNRCRKIAVTPANHPVEVKDIASTSKSPIGWWLAGLVGAGVIGYAIYEWRHEILKKVTRLRVNKTKK